VHPLEVLEGFIGSGVALVIFGIPAALAQERHSPIVKDPGPGTASTRSGWRFVAFILVAAIVVNIAINTRYAAVADRFPLPRRAGLPRDRGRGGAAQPRLVAAAGRVQGAVFLLSLVLCASMMPVERLPAASWQTALGLGFLSAVFDNIPLTARSRSSRAATTGASWPTPSGFGGSMIWFGSSAGVALSNMYPEARSVGKWLRHGWPIALAYVAGFFVMLATIGFHPGSVLKGSVGG
jgi:hypothetical protein